MTLSFDLHRNGVFIPNEAVRDVTEDSISKDLEPVQNCVVRIGDIVRRVTQRIAQTRVSSRTTSLHSSVVTVSYQRKMR